MKPVLTYAARRLGRFLRDEEASLSVELVLILPLLLWGFLTVITIFDVFRARNLALKANYAVSDLLSRETSSIDASYLAGVNKIFAYLTKGQSSTWVRVTQVVCTADCASNKDRVLEVDFSRATPGQPTYDTDAMRSNLAQYVPLLPSGQWVFVVETSVDYVPPFLPPVNLYYRDDKGKGHEVRWGIMKRNTFRDVVVTEPRFGPKLCWSGISGCS